MHFKWATMKADWTWHSPDWSLTIIKKPFFLLINYKMWWLYYLEIYSSWFHCIFRKIMQKLRHTQFSNACRSWKTALSIHSSSTRAQTIGNGRSKNKKQAKCPENAYQPYKAIYKRCSLAAVATAPVIYAYKLV